MPAIDASPSLRVQLLKVKKAIEKGDMEIGRIYGQNAIRLKNEGNGYLKLASRMDAVRAAGPLAERARPMYTRPTLPRSPCRWRHGSRVQSR